MPMDHHTVVILAALLSTLLEEPGQVRALAPGARQQKGYGWGKDKGGSKTLLMPWLDQAPALPGPCLLENHKILDCQPGRILESNTIIGQKPRIHRGKRRYHGYQWQNQDENPGVLLLAWGFAFLWRLSRIFKSLGNRELQRSSNSDFIQR